MRFQLFFMLGAVVLSIIVLLSSKFVRALCSEAILRPRHRCEIQTHGDEVLIKRID